MPSPVVKVRFDQDTLKMLTASARREGMTVSEVLREGFRLFQQVHDRQEGMRQLISLVDGPEPRKIRFEPRA